MRTLQVPGTPPAPPRDSQPVAQAPGRRAELDVLRALVVVGLVFFHTTVIFGAGEFPIKAATENRVAAVFLGFGATWGMPLLFLISGTGIWYSLRRTAAALGHCPPPGCRPAAAGRRQASAGAPAPGGP